MQIKVHMEPDAPVVIDPLTPDAPQPLAEVAIYCVPPLPVIGDRQVYSSGESVWNENW